MKLIILVGTMTSTADYVAQAIQMDCADLVEEIEVKLMDGLEISVFARRCAIPHLQLDLRFRATCRTTRASCTTRLTATPNI